MLRATVNINRKISENYNSTGFGLSLDGEIQGSIDDPELVIERIKQLYDLAEEALDQQLDRYKSDSAMASRDQGTSPPERNGHHANGSTNGQSPSRNGHQNGQSNPQTSVM